MLVCGPERPLGLFEVLARNRQSAVGLSRRTRRALLQTPRVFTIPPRQQLSNNTRLAIRTRNVIRLGGRRIKLALFYVFCSLFNGFFSNFTPFHTKRKADTYVQKGERDGVAKSISRENESVDVSRVQHVGLFSRRILAKFFEHSFNRFGIVYVVVVALFSFFDESSHSSVVEMSPRRKCNF